MDVINKFRKCALLALVFWMELGSSAVADNLCDRGT